MPEKPACARIGPDLLRIANQMIDPLERNVDEVVVGVIGHAKRRRPLRLNVIAEIERDDLDLDPRANQLGETRSKKARHCALSSFCAAVVSSHSNFPAASCRNQTILNREMLPLRQPSKTSSSRAETAVLYICPSGSSPSHGSIRSDCNGMCSSRFSISLSRVQTARAPCRVSMCLAVAS
jgi:hypothetical protein